jgi:hypothetical protein
MATVITVHGTNASGPEHGDRWWQKGGVLEAHLARWVEDSNGPFKLAPLIWDGANQETSRRAGAEKLLSEMEKLEAAGESLSPGVESSPDVGIENSLAGDRAVVHVVVAGDLAPRLANGQAHARPQLLANMLQCGNGNVVLRSCLSGLPWRTFGQRQ